MSRASVLGGDSEVAGSKRDAVNCTIKRMNMSTETMQSPATMRNDQYQIKIAWLVTPAFLVSFSNYTTSHLLLSRTEVLDCLLASYRGKSDRL